MSTKIHVVIDTDNDALNNFEDYDVSRSIKQTFIQLSKEFNDNTVAPGTGWTHIIRDVNGNRIGFMTYNQSKADIQTFKEEIKHL